MSMIMGYIWSTWGVHGVCMNCLLLYIFVYKYIQKWADNIYPIYLSLYIKRLRLAGPWSFLRAVFSDRSVFSESRSSVLDHCSFWLVFSRSVVHFYIYILYIFFIFLYVYIFLHSFFHEWPTYAIVKRLDG